MYFAEIYRVARKLYSQGSRRSAFGLGGIGAGMLAFIAFVDPRGLGSAEFPAEHQRRKDHKISAEPRWYEIDDIIQSRRCRSEKPVAFVPIADHRVHRVDRLVEEAVAKATAALKADYEERMKAMAAEYETRIAELQNQKSGMKQRC